MLRDRHSVPHTMRSRQGRRPGLANGRMTMMTAEAQSEHTGKQRAEVPPGFVELPTPKPFEIWRIQAAHIAGMSASSQTQRLCCWSAGKGASKSICLWRRSIDASARLSEVRPRPTDRLYGGTASRRRAGDPGFGSSWVRRSAGSGCVGRPDTLGDLAAAVALDQGDLDIGLAGRARTAAGCRSSGRGAPPCRR